MTAARPGARADEADIVRSSAIVGIGTALSRITGFARVAAVAYALGVSGIAGVYSYANETPNIVFELLLGGILTATLVPLFVRNLQARDVEATSAIMTTAFVALVAITALGVALAPWIVRLYTLRVTGPDRAAQQELATTLLRCFMPQMLFYGVTALATAFLNAQRRFVAAAFAPILNNVVVTALFIALPRIADGPLTIEHVRNDTPLILLLGLGTTAGIAAMAVALVPAVRNAGIRLRWHLSWNHPAVRAMLRLSGWTLGYVIANQIALWVVLVLANSRAGGPFAYLSAYAFFVLPHGLFSVSFMTSIGPELAAAVDRQDWPALRLRFTRTLRLTLVVIVPSAAILIGLARPIVVALLQRGAFSASDAATVAHTLALFAVGLPFFSTYLFALRSFYAMQDTRTPFLLNCLENAVNVVLAVALYSTMGIPGLALSFSVAYAVGAVVTLRVLSNRIGSLAGRGLGTTILRVTIASAAVLGATWGVARAIGWSSPARAIAATAVGGVVALAVAALGLSVLRVEEIGALRALGARRR